MLGSLRKRSVRVIAAATAAVFVCLIASDHYPSSAQSRSIRPAIPIIAPGAAYTQTNLVSDVPGLSPLLDPLMVNPWGIAVRGGSPFWIANDGTSTTQLVRGDVGGAPVSLNPSPQTINLPGGLPTGIVGNTTSDFQIAPPGGGTPAPAAFIFDSITGNVIGWNPAQSTSGTVVVSNPGHVYTGLAIGSNSGGNRLYAADFANNHIDVFDGTFTPTTVTGGFIDATIPAGFSPYNIQNLGGSLYVTYGKIGVDGKAENGVGNGYVRKFNTDGVRDLTFAINNGSLDAPWGITIAPASYGIFGGALLVGNFSDQGTIHAYNPSTGAFFGTVQDEAGNAVDIPQLWALTFGNGVSGGDVDTLYFTAGIGREEHGLFGKLKPTTATATSLIQFASDDFGVNESTDHVDFTIVRNGDTSGTATVNYNTFDQSRSGHANQKADYEISAGTVTFNPGETSKTVRVFLIDDNFVEGDEVIELDLSNPTGTGVGLGDPHHSTITILENDTVPPTTNPIDGAQFFVRQLYVDLLNREPDANAAALVSQITACGADQSCIAAKRVAVANAVFNSNDVQSNGSLIMRAYRAAYGLNGPFATTPVLYGDFERAYQALLNNVNLGSPGDPQLEANKQAFYANLVSSPAFVGAYPTTMTPAQFVDALYANAGVVPSTTERQAAIDEFGGAGTTTDQGARARALRRVTENGTFVQNEVNRVKAGLLYFLFMRRDADFGGFLQVLGRLNSFQGDTLASNLIRSALASTEYRLRFGPDPGGIHPNQAPIAVNDTATGNSFTAFPIDVLANDSDPDGDQLTIQSVTPGTGGTPVISPDGRSINFIPTPGFVGTGTFQYTITDNGVDGQVPPTPNPKTATATVTVNIPGVTITGNIKQFGTNANLSGVFVVLNGPGLPGGVTVSTDGSGNYQFSGVPTGGNVTVTPVDPTRAFEPASRSYSNVLSNISGVNFIGYSLPNGLPRDLKVMNSYGVLGQTVTVPVVLTSLGNEAKATFSLNYDPTVLSNPVVTCGAASGAACGLSVDTSQAGKIGISVTPTAAYTAGPREAVKVTFNVLPTVVYNTPITFGNTPVNSSVTSATADQLPFTTTPGFVALQQGSEGDVAARFTGDGSLLSNDVTLLRNFVVGTAVPDPIYNELQRADVAPKLTKGDGVLDATDVVQERRYVAGLDAPIVSGGPFTSNPGGPIAPPANSRDTGRAMKVVDTNAVAGNKVSVDVTLDASGDEVASSFTLNFDAMKLSNPHVTLGSGAPADSVLTVNTADANTGRVNVLIDSSNSFERSAGKQVVTVTFDVAPRAVSGDTEISFANGSVSDANAADLATAYTSGKVTINGANSAGVSLSGRVLTPQGAGLRNASVTLTDANGNSRTVTTSSLGFYSFDSVAAGAEYTITATSKRYRFSPARLTVRDNLVDVNFTGME